MTEIIILLAVIVLIRMQLPLFYRADIVLQLLAELCDNSRIKNKRESHLLEIIAIMLLEWKKLLAGNKKPGRSREIRYPEIDKGCLDAVGCG